MYTIYLLYILYILYICQQHQHLCTGESTGNMLLSFHVCKDCSSLRTWRRGNFPHKVGDAINLAEGTFSEQCLTGIFLFISRNLFKAVFSRNISLYMEESFQSSVRQEYFSFYGGIFSEQCLKGIFLFIWRNLFRAVFDKSISLY